MAYNTKKYLDEEGLKQVVRLLDEYPDNQILGTVIDEIQGELDKKADIVDIPEVPVQDVQVNGTSILDNGVANVPIGDANTYGVYKADQAYGITNYNGFLRSVAAPLGTIQNGLDADHPIVSFNQHQSIFYGLAKAAGADMKGIAGITVGQYPDAQKEAIQSMLGITQMLAPENPNLVASQPYAIGDVFTANGHLYKATVAIAQDEAIIPDTNCIETTMVDAGGLKVVRLI